MAKKKKSMKSKTITKKKGVTTKKNSNLKSKKKTIVNSKTKNIKKSEVNETKKKNQSIKNKQIEEKNIVEKPIEKKAIEKKTTDKKQIEKKTIDKKQIEEKIKDSKETKKEVIEAKKSLEIDLPKKKVSKIEKQKEETESKQIDKTKTKKKNKKVSNVHKIERTKKNAFLSTIKKYRRKIKIYGIFSVISKRMCAVIASAFLIFIFLLVGLNYISPKTDLIDLESISKDIDQLKTVKFNINNSNEIVTSSNAYTNLTNYYLYDYKSTFNIDEEWIKDAVIKYNKSNKGLYMAILPNSGYEEKIKSGVNKFLNSKNIKATYFEYDGYMFYINSSNNNSVISKIKQTQIRVFDILEELNTTGIENMFGISSNLYTDYVVKTAMLKTEITGYMIFKPKNKNAAVEIDRLMDEYFNELEEKYSNDEDKLKLIRTRYEGTYNGYLVYLISKDNELVNQLIKK